MTDETPEPPRPDPKRRHGLIIVNTGDGKGKTTAALGLAFRALGSGFKVFMVQYIKGKWKTGEKKLADRLAPDIEILPMGDGFTWDTKNPAQDIATTLKIWEVSKEAITLGQVRHRDPRRDQRRDEARLPRPARSSSSSSRPATRGSTSS